MVVMQRRIKKKVLNTNCVSCVYKNTLFTEKVLKTVAEYGSVVKNITTKYGKVIRELNVSNTIFCSFTLTTHLG